ncbi:hypothetical protein [Microcoleus sp.]|uniref:hypothetical protein n=1 Tax=Microcoleus sp. TaxID=44472 RepID=UPI003C73F4F3
MHTLLLNALTLTYEQQEMLIKILQNRHRESRRAEIAADAQQTLADFRAGKFRSQSAEEVIAALGQYLSTDRSNLTYPKNSLYSNPKSFSITG